jgi:hypothetical protein
MGTVTNDDGGGEEVHALLGSQLLEIRGVIELGVYVDDVRMPPVTYRLLLQRECPSSHTIAHHHYQISAYNRQEKLKNG